MVNKYQDEADEFNNLDNKEKIGKDCEISTSFLQKQDDKIVEESSGAFIKLSSKNSEKGYDSPRISEDDDSNTINLYYRGNKVNFNKGRFAERSDVVYKTLMRSTRRYLVNLLQIDFQNQEQKLINSKIMNYSELVKEFYDKYFGQIAGTELHLNDEEESDVVFVLGLMLDKIHSPQLKNIGYTKLSSAIKSTMKSFNKIKYANLFSNKCFNNFFRMFSKSGLMDDMMEAYPTLSVSSETYKKAGQNIVNFIEHPKLF